MNVPILRPEQRWECPSCGAQHVTHEARPHTPFHPCPKVNGFTTPYARVHGRELVGVVHRVVEREDYIGSERVQTDGAGRPVMAIRTERADGYDTHVFAPTATAAGASGNQ
jgi:hypothetical protein